MKRFFLVVIWMLVVLKITSSQIRTDFYGITEKNGTYLPDTIILFDEDSVPVNVVDLIDKPTLISFVYYKCPGLCSPLMKGLAELIDNSDIQAGTHYQIFTISIDAREPPSLAKSMKNSLLVAMKKGSDAEESWKFFTGDAYNIQRITNAAGWQFKRNEVGFIHAMAVILVTPDRMISQYLYGTFFMPMHFQMAVSDAWKGLSVPARIKTLKYCYDYASKTNRNARMVALSFGAFIILAAAGLFLRLLLRPQVKDNESKT
jgi:protein SCO1/2